MHDDDLLGKETKTGRELIFAATCELPEERPVSDSSI